MGGRFTERERTKARVQVLVSESPPPSGESLRSILEAGGFDIVGTASSPEELSHLLLWSDPHVIVFDAETSVTTVAETREAAPHAGLVVVWPAGVTASAADVRVEPWRAEFDLGKAVRAARVRHAPAARLTLVPEPKPESGTETELERAAREFEEDDAAAASLEAAALVASAGAGGDDELAPDSVSRRRANLALLFAAASFALLVLIFSAQLAERRLAPAQQVAAPVVIAQSPSGVATGGGNAGLLTENPAPLAGVQSAVLLTQPVLTQPVSGGFGVQPTVSGGGSTGSSAHASGGAPGSSNPVRTHLGDGSSNGSPNNNGGPNPAQPSPSGHNHAPGQGGSKNHGGNNNGGGANGQSGQTHGQSGQMHGQSGQTHGQSGQTHGQSGQTHGHSGQTHGHSAQSHGHSGH